MIALSPKRDRTHYMRWYRHAARVGDTLANVTATTVCGRCGAEHLTYQYDPMHLCGPGEGSSTVWLRSRRACVVCPEVEARRG